MPAQTDLIEAGIERVQLDAEAARVSGADPHGLRGSQQGVLRGGHQVGVADQGQRDGVVAHGLRGDADVQRMRTVAVEHPAVRIGRPDGQGAGEAVGIVSDDSERAGVREIHAVEALGLLWRVAGEGVARLPELV